MSTIRHFSFSLQFPDKILNQHEKTIQTTIVSYVYIYSC